MDIYSVYEEEIIWPLERLQKKGFGKIFKLAKQESTGYPILGFKKGDPKMLVVAGHHASEFYGIPEAILKYLENGKDVVAVPFIDVGNFCLNKTWIRESKRWFGKEELGAKILSNFFQDLSVAPTKRKEYWHYGYDLISELNALEKLVKEAELVVDFHNSAYSSYFFITATYRRFFKKCVKLIQREGLEVNSHTPSFCSPIKDVSGITLISAKDNLLDYSAQQRVNNLAVEVPMLDRLNNKLGHDFSVVTETNVKLLKLLEKMV